MNIRLIATSRIPELNIVTPLFLTLVVGIDTKYYRDGKTKYNRTD
jgi:hypothetical protein